MVIAITLLIVLAAVGAVIAPLLRFNSFSPSSQSWERERLEELLSRRDSAYDALRDLDFEYQIGNLSESDYKGLREHYRFRAAAVLRLLHHLGSQTERSVVSGAKEEAGLKSDGKCENGTCHACAKPNEAVDIYCRYCGTRLR